MHSFYLTDLDKTFLRSDLSVGEYSRTIWNTLVNRGVRLSVATARSLTGVRKLLRDLELKEPLILLDGVVIATVAGEMIRVAALERDLGDAVIETGRRVAGMEPLLVGLEADGKESFIYPRDPNRWQKELLATFHNDRRVLDVEPLRAMKRNLKIVYMESEKVTEELEKALKEEYGDAVETKRSADPYIDCFFLTVLHPHGDKAHALAALEEIEGVDREHTTVFGDSHNDLGLFEMAGRKIAVANAIEDCRRSACRVGRTPGTGTSLLFAVVHGDIGAVDERFDIRSVFREKSDSDARGDFESFFVENHRRPDDSANLFGDFRGILFLFDFPEKHDEFVSGEACGCVSLPYGRCKTFAYDLQNPVACRVSVGIVDLLETVKIEEKQREFFIPFPGVCQCFGKEFEKPVAVGQARQGIITGEIFEMVFQRMCFGFVFPDSLIVFLVHSDRFIAEKKRKNLCQGSCSEKRVVVQNQLEKQSRIHRQDKSPEKPLYRSERGRGGESDHQHDTVDEKVVAFRNVSHKQHHDHPEKACQ